MAKSLKFFCFLAVTILLNTAGFGCARSTEVQQIYYPSPAIAEEGVVVPKGARAPSLPRTYLLPLYEELVYEIRWLGMRVGTVTATIKGLAEFEGREVYDFELRAVSNSWLGRVCRIDSRLESLMDAETLSTLRQHVDRKEGGYRKDAAVIYDQEQGVASFHNRTDGSRKQYAVPRGVVDALSSVYYFRTLPLRSGQQIAFAVDVNEKVYEFYADVKHEKLIRLFGFEPQPAVFIQPYVTFDDENVKKGKVSGYFSQGPYHIPLTARIEAPLFTSATVTLKSVSYPRGRKPGDNS